ncbi:VOC family protein [Microlunatus flavus]|uniref:VOC family protein n=1 Tax=Microlunatus flavus TaxID=1036181 RepID=UPI001E335628|nr:VOC family protein [Microlunatus flavus]
MADDHGAGRVRFKDLCVDVGDLDAAAAFFGPLLGLEQQERRDAVLLLGDDVAEHAVWLNLVPEPRTVKNRVHLDVDVAAVDDVLALDARVLDASQPWTVLTQDQAGELCVFVRPPDRLRPYRLYELVVDCADPWAVGAWWAERFGVELQDDGEVVWLDGGPDGRPATTSGLPWELVFAAVPERKRVKNRVHFDVEGSTAALLEAGATLLRAQDDEVAWDVLADPEGNEFCVFAPGKGGAGNPRP